MAAQINGTIAACYGILVLAYAKYCAPPPPSMSRERKRSTSEKGAQEPDGDDEETALVTADV